MKIFIHYYMIFVYYVYDICSYCFSVLAPGPNQDGSGKEVVPVKEDKNDSMILTHDDRRDGVPNFYHAYVLFAQEDWSFVRELLARMRASGFKVYHLILLRW